MPNASFNSSVRFSVSSGCISSGCGVYKKSRPYELLVLHVITKNVANVLAQKAFDAFSKFLHAVDVFLLHPPRSVFGHRADAA
jgi:hypothetical protein